MTLQPNWPLIYRGETITVRCDIQGDADTQWEYEWRGNNVDTSRKDRAFTISSASISHTVVFRCMGRKDFVSTMWSDATTLTVLGKSNMFISYSKYYFLCVNLAR